MELTFLGAAQTVTGSRYLVEREGKRVLVDCGLFQGLKELRLRNWAPFPVPADSLDAVVLSHAHIDHSGYLPLLIRQGFEGPVYCSPATLALCRILLPDSARLQEEEARYANQRGYSKHHPALPLYDERDALHALEHFQPVELGARTALPGGLELQLQSAGHILGACSVRLRAPEGELLLSGDLGRLNDPVMMPPQWPHRADWLVLESTYGGKLHPSEDTEAELADVVAHTAGRGGVVVMPAFCVGRAQLILHLLAKLRAARRIPPIPIYLNSPMASDTTDLYRHFRHEHRLDHAATQAMFEVAERVVTVEESKRLNTLPGPMVIIAGSGMATGGRVVHHLKAFAPDARNTIVLVGYQAPGTRGASLAGGAPAVKIHGEYVPIHAQVVQLHGLSAHADAEELMTWVTGLEKPPRQTFITHGEPEQSLALRARLEALGWTTQWPAPTSKVKLER